jgi:ABC-type sugar transport system ATPase subunit
LPIEKTSPADLVLRMIGREVVKCDPDATRKSRSAEPVLQVRGLSDAAAHIRERSLLKDISFSVHAGEIVALAGLTGAGRTETALSVFGARPKTTGQVLIDGRRIPIRSPRDAIQAGIGYLSEDRKESGLFLEMGIAANMAAANLKSFGTWWMSRKNLRDAAQTYRERLHIAAADIDAPVVRLSGGNQQKVLIARWLLLRPKVLFVDEPTRGIDVGVKGEVHGLLRELAGRGAAVVVISSDMPEVLAVADRVLVMREGRIAGELDRAGASEEAILRLASSGLAA